MHPTERKEAPLLFRLIGERVLIHSILAILLASLVSALLLSSFKGAFQSLEEQVGEVIFLATGGDAPN